MDKQLEDLRNAFATAPAGPVVINAAFWIAAGVPPPQNFDDELRASYRLADSASGLVVTYDRANVSAVADGRFTITGVALTFLNLGTDASCATIEGIGTGGTPTLGIDVSPPQGWDLSKLFTYMATAGWPMSWLLTNEQRFYFTTANEGLIDRSGTELAVVKGQNVYGPLGIPASAGALFALVNGLNGPAGALQGSGRIVLNKAFGSDSPPPLDDAPLILYPDTDLTAFIPASGPLSLLFVQVSDPRISITVVTREEPDEKGKKDYQQRTVFTFGLKVTLLGADGMEVPMLMSAAIGQPVDVATSKANSQYEFYVTRVDEEHRITPGAIVALMAGQSYFSRTPSVLQQYLSAVELLGFTISGRVGPSLPDALCVVIGSDGGPANFFTDPGNGQAFALKSFALTWRMLQPFDASARQHMVSFGAVLTLFPTIFKKKNGEDGGEFEVLIDQDLNAEGKFTGKVSLDDVLNGITNGAIGLPNGVSVDFSDIYLTVQPSQKAYSLGFTVDAEVDVPFIKNPDPGSPPLIQLVGMRFALGARTPDPVNKEVGVSGRTVYTGSIDGQIIIGPVAANVRVDYDGGAPTPLWQLSASLAAPLSLSDLLKQFFRTYSLPDFLPGDLVVEAFDIDAKIPADTKRTLEERMLSTRIASHVSGTHWPHGWRSPVRRIGEGVIPPSSDMFLLGDAVPGSSYRIHTRIRWTFEIASTGFDILAELGLDYDASRPKGKEFAGSVIGTIDIDGIGPVEIGYRFGPAADDLAYLVGPPSAEMLDAIAIDDDSTVLWLCWKGFRAEYSFTNDAVTFSLKGWTVGSLITALMEMLGDPYFTLPSPWDLLNKIPLDGLSITLNLKKGATERVSASYTLAAPLELGIVTIEGLTFKQVKGKVTLAIKGSTNIPGLDKEDLFKDGQDVEDMPKVPGRGNTYFHLNMLALGQRVAINGAPAFKTTKAVIEAMEKIPASDTKDLPFDPTNRVPGQPYYDPSAGWLVAMHFGVLKLPDPSTIYTIDLMVVFNDPNLYGLRLGLNGDKVKVLKGLAIDVLYKKITDDIGCYQIEFALPSALRNLDIGAFAVTLPVIGVQIYTNGDFLIDLGFPYDLDFTRSFSLQAIILGIPVLGSAGLYFGKLSQATAPNLPKTTKGTFHPVIVFGFGAQIGVGKYIDKGILKAGFSITVFGVIEGTIATWHPYQIGNSGNSNELQGDYYFKISGTFGIIGKLYGSIDFVIIKADVSLLVRVVARVVYESFRRIPLSLTADVSISVSIKIDLGLFAISISFSFAASLSVELTIGSDSQAPWDDAPPLHARTLHALGIAHAPLRLDLSRGLRLRAAGTQAIELTAVPQFTVLAADGATYAQQEGAFVLLFVMDSPDLTGSDDGANTSFGRLCHALLPWVLASVVPGPGHERLPPVPVGSTSRPLLEAVLRALSDPAHAPFTAKQIMELFAAGCTVTVSAGDGTLPVPRQEALNAGSTIFPAFPFLKLTIPDPKSASGDVTVAFEDYVRSTPAYQEEVRRMFDKVAARVADEQGGGTGHAANALADGASMAASVFTDYFLLLARQLVQGAIDAFDDLAYALDANTSIGGIVSWADGQLAGQLAPQALAMANLVYPLTPGRTITIAGISYMVQTGDTLASIASRYSDPATPQRWVTQASSLVVVNAGRNDLLNAGVAITYAGSTYVTRTGDDFNTVAKALNVDLGTLASDPALATMPGLLAPAVVLTVGEPPGEGGAVELGYTTGPDDTLQRVIERFQVPLASVLTPTTIACVGLFTVDPTLRFAVPGLIVLPVDVLWPAMLRTGVVRGIAAMAARYMLHGMRLPVEKGLDLSKDFLYGTPHWPDPQHSYGVYQLTGQQFPLAENNPKDSIGLTRPDKDHDWITLGTGATLAISIGPPNANTLGPLQLLTLVLGWARANGYTPNVPSLAAEPATKLEPRRYGMESYALWDTSDIARLLEVTKPPANKAMARAQAEEEAQRRPVLWALSSALLRSIAERQARLANVVPTVGGLLPYMPVLAPCIGSTDPATGRTHFTPIPDFSFALRAEFRIKRLAQDADLAPQRPDANDIVPPGPDDPGSPARKLAPFTYEIIGPNPAEAILLERMLTAMASEGEGVVDELFLLYHDGSNGSAGLTSRANSEFLSFIVQSNLSTETNPPATVREAILGAAIVPPTGIANRPAEFIRLLWELSTVNSGGTYLFYQLLADGSGLPAALFDTNGIATLTLVAAIARDAAHPTGGRVWNAINSLITTSAIDPQHAIVDLAGVPAATTSLPLSPTQTLADIAAFYGADPGALVQLNATAPLTNGVPIPITGLFRQLLPDDFGPDKDPLQALADYYSIGAVTPITKADIVAFNPGVPETALSVFRIPPFIYAVAANGPGSSFGSMAAYYAADLSALAFQALHVPGLFVGPTITIDPLYHDAQSVLGTGNAGLAVQRERGAAPQPLPPAPTPEQVADYAKATLLQTYQLLSAAIGKNVFFQDSADSAAFGPQDPSPHSADALPAERQVRKLADTRALPATDQLLFYEQAIGFTKVPGSCTVNAAVPPVTPQLPAVSANPYIGVGSILQFRLAWQDLFGSRTPTPFNAPPPGYPGPFAGLPVPILYTDRLLPIDQWPSTTRAYRYSGDAGKPMLELLLKFDPTPYEPATREDHRHLDTMRALDDRPVWQRNATDDLAKFTLIYFQLTQDYTPLNIPGLSGPAVSMSLRNTLLEVPEAPLPDPMRLAILGYVDAAVIYLTARATGDPSPAPVDVTASMPIDLAAVVSSSDLVRLELEVIFTRQGQLVDPLLRGLSDGVVIRTTVPVDGDAATGTHAAGRAKNADDPDYPVALRAFATAFEQAFVTVDWRMRLGTGPADPGQPGDARASTVWAVRMAEPTGPAPSGIGFAFDGDPRYYAPRPIASALRTLTVAVDRYATGAPYPDGSPLPVTFTSVDPNAWLADLLAAVDNVLSATCSTPLFILDRLLGLKEANGSGEEAGYAARLLQHKRSLAEAIASTATSVLDRPDSEPLRNAAIDKLEQALLRRLSNATTLTCVMVFPVNDARCTPPVRPGASAPRLFGQPVGRLPVSSGDSADPREANDNFALSTAKIPLVPAGEEDTSAMAILVNSRSAEKQAYVELGMDYELSHVEHDIHAVPGIDRYERSAWITFLTGPYRTPMIPAVGSAFAVPVALRALPAPATVVVQTGEPAAPAGEGRVSAAGAITPAELKNWSYRFSYLLAQAAQDTVMAQVEFNRPTTDVQSFATTAEDDLYAALAQFVAIYPAITRDLETYLRPINGKTEAGAPEVTNAHYAIAALETVVGNVAAAYKAWADPAHALKGAVVVTPPRVVYRFEIALEEGASDPKEAVVHILPQSFVVDGVVVPTNFLPLAEVAIDPDNYAPHVIAQDPTTGEVRYTYLLRPDAKDPSLPRVLPYATALLIAERRVGFAPLDLFTLQDCRASVQVVRNRHLSPDPAVRTAAVFQFATAEARFADPLKPLLRYADLALDGDATDPKPIRTWLNDFFAELLASTMEGAPDQPVLVNLATNYGYQLAASIPQAPATRIPISLLPPTSTEGQLDPAFLNDVAGVAQEWLATQRPVVDDTSRFEFGLSIFSATGNSDMPLLRIGALTLRSKNVEQE